MKGKMTTTVRTNKWISEIHQVLREEEELLLKKLESSCKMTKKTLLQSSKRIVDLKSRWVDSVRKERKAPNQLLLLEASKKFQVFKMKLHGNLLVTRLNQVVLSLSKILNS